MHQDQCMKINTGIVRRSSSPQGSRSPSHAVTAARESGFEGGISLLEGLVHEDQRMKINPTSTS
jgi:hypothetical protein